MVDITIKNADLPSRIGIHGIQVGTCVYALEKNQLTDPVLNFACPQLKSFMYID